MFQAQDLLDIKQASTWASDEYIGKDVTPSNITYLINYLRISKIGAGGKTLIAKQELINYYENYQREAVYKKQFSFKKATSFSNRSAAVERRLCSLTKVMEQINTDDLIYWIDKAFVQDTAQERIGRNLNDEEIVQLKKMVEFGLWDAVFDTVKIAIDEVTN